MANDVRARMKKQATSWKNADPVSGGGFGLPDGKCQLMILEPASGAVITEDADDAIRARIKVEVVACSDDSFVGRGGSKSWTLINGDETPNEKGMGYLKGDLKAMGVEDVDKLSVEKIGEALAGCSGIVMDCNISHYNDRNGIPRETIYLNSKAGDTPKKSAKKNNGKKSY